MNEFWQIYPVYCRKYICLVGLYFQLLWIFSPSRLTFVGWSQGKTKLWRLWLNVLKSTENSITNSPFLWRNLNNIPHYLQIFTKSLFVLSFDVVLLRYFTIKFPKCFVITHNIYYVVCENLVIRSSLSPTNHSHILACTYFFDLSVKCENNCRFVFKEGVKAKVRTHALFFFSTSTWSLSELSWWLVLSCQVTGHTSAKLG